MLNICSQIKWIIYEYALPAASVLEEYTNVRVPDDHAIADLAMYNYVEVVHQLNVCCNTVSEH